MVNYCTHTKIDTQKYMHVHNITYCIHLFTHMRTKLLPYLAFLMGCTSRSVDPLVLSALVAKKTMECKYLLNTCTYTHTCYTHVHTHTPSPAFLIVCTSADPLVLSATVAK